MRNLDWNEGAPDELVPGMIVCNGSGQLTIIGHVDNVLSANAASEIQIEYSMGEISKWAYLIQPYQLEWLESMNKQHGKGKA